METQIVDPEQLAERRRHLDRGLDLDLAVRRLDPWIFRGQFEGHTCDIGVEGGRDDLDAADGRGARGGDRRLRARV